MDYGGQGERFLFRRTDGPDTWAVQFDGAAVRLGEADNPCEVTHAGEGIAVKFADGGELTLRSAWTLGDRLWHPVRAGEGGREEDEQDDEREDARG